MISITDFQANLRDVQQRIAAACARSGRNPHSVRLIVVTKTHPAETLQTVINAGIADLGENHVQEIQAKAPQLTGTRCMHLIGHLQTNKVSKVVPLVDWIQSVDSEHLLRKIETHCRQIGKKLNILVQVNTSGEQSKSGCIPDDTLRLCELAAKSDAIAFCGLMTIGPITTDEKAVRKSFSLLRHLGEQCRTLADRIELSMGMSGDFERAIEEGSTMVRIGSLLLGERTST